MVFWKYGSYTNSVANYSLLLQLNPVQKLAHGIGDQYCQHRQYQVSHILKAHVTFSLHRQKPLQHLWLRIFFFFFCPYYVLQSFYQVISTISTENCFLPLFKNLKEKGLPHLCWIPVFPGSCSPQKEWLDKPQQGAGDLGVQRLCAQCQLPAASSETVRSVSSCGRRVWHRSLEHLSSPVSSEWLCPMTKSLSTLFIPNAICFNT